ncbi:glutathionylspermidine synthase family protein [Sandaracinus amylolyticus]|uniref:Glutathionylspermidine synthase pre-ATP-grasp-like domain-containing protein n=1 Tax=Sandaracinus amylolyticus TaxID=927083 RepID=A0A0F6WAG7_9BACT|nr:glutathionylspermidine synthase family protein [Sandaracinus amylolyticus]AKF11555.1 hypothetical protein DB32_008704 [Sandaracinus amylolyticus]
MIDAAIPIPLACTPALAPEAHAALRRRLIFDHHKWDPQVGDVSVIAPYALCIARRTWEHVAALALELARELLDAERAILASPRAIARLALPLPIHAVLRARLLGAPSPGIARFVRFDFHPTPQGWRISEANSDVPGGLIEGGALSSLIAQHHAGARPAGDPGGALAASIARATRVGARIGLVHATAYNDDRQVTFFLADRLRAIGLEGLPCGPHDLAWRRGRAHVAGAPLDTLFRFFPAEWLPNLLLESAWWRFFRGARTPVANPGAALLTQSKRFPLTWDALGLAMPAWRALLPETRDVREVDVASGEWVLKPVLGRVGDGVTIPGATAPREWARALRDVRRHPRAWIAQRSFETLAVSTPEGPMYPCLGVFVVDGAIAGAYARLSAHPRIDDRAREAGVLVSEDRVIEEPDVARA